MNIDFRYPFSASPATLAQLAAADPERYAESILGELSSDNAMSWENVGAEAVSGSAAGSINLFLRLNNIPIVGESPVRSPGRQDSIECLSYQQGVVTAREAGSGAAIGRRQYAPIVIQKRIDKSSPLLVKGLTQNEVAQGTFKFYRLSPKGDGTTEQYYTVAFQQGRISAFKQSTIDGLIEELAFVFQSISWTFVDGGISHQDAWSA